MHPIIESLFGTKELPSLEVELLKKILNDNFVTLCAQEQMIEFFAPAAIRKMHPTARAALITRISPPPKPVYKVFWEMIGGIHSGTPHIRGICGQCKQDVIFKGQPDYAQHVVWSHCSLGPSKIPESVIQDYETKHGLRL
jgi:hypothetical protein